MKNIIILLPGPFSKRDYDRFGIELLKKNFLVYAIDCCAWTNPNFWELYSKEVFKCKEHVVISCKEDFSNFISRIDKAIVIDFIQRNEKTMWMRNKLKKKGYLFVNAHIGLIPQQGKSIFKGPNKSRIVNSKTIIKPWKIFFEVYKILKQKFYEKKNFVYDMSILGGSASLKQNIAKKKIYAHSMDYDVYLALKNTYVDSKSRYAVFIDGGMVHHPDYDIHNVEKPVKEKEYYPLLIKFLKKFETETKLKIKVAIHPKTSFHNYQKSKNLFAGISYTMNNTAELIKNSEIVLLHSSTSLSFAILFNKPVIFLTSNELEKSWLGPRINNLARIVNGKLINMNNNFDDKLNFQSLLKIDVDKVKYSEYLNQYLKMPNSPDISLWKIFTEYLKTDNLVKLR